MMTSPVLCNKLGNGVDAMIYKQYLGFAIAAAREAGDILRDHFGQLATGDIEYKGQIDLVTAADKASEAKIVEMIREQFPNHSILAEESGRTDQDSEFCWVIDPLDGTTNFAHGFPWFAVSIALRQKNETVVGVVYHVMKDELFTAVLGEGAYCNGSKLRVSDTKQLIQGLFATGYPYDPEKVGTDNIKQTKSILAKSRGIRRTGSAALDLCYVAKGVFTAFWEFGLNPWDVAAGALLVLEAGGQVTDILGQPLPFGRCNIAASNGIVHKDFLAALAE